MAYEFVGLDGLEKMKEIKEMNGWERLALMVVAQAVLDYMEARRYLAEHKERNGKRELMEIQKGECMLFFRKRLGMYADIEADHLIRLIEEKLKEDA